MVIVSRLRFFTAIMILVVVPFPAAAESLTAAAAIQRVQQRYLPPAPPDTVDTIKAGDPATPVIGIAVTFLATMDVLREAARRGTNLVITHEPTFYNHRDDPNFFTEDPVYREKLAFIEQHHMVVFRLHDEIHASPPDHIAMGLIQELGWEKYIQPGNPFFITIPRTTLAELAGTLERRLKTTTVRVVGNPELSIVHVAIVPGAAGLQKQVLALRRDDVEVVIAGEASEWETDEYARDAAAQGRHKALILLGHEPSEEPGMVLCAQQLRTLFPDLRVVHIPAGTPVWSPEHPPRTGPNATVPR